VPEIRDATPADALAVARVHVHSWQVAYRGLIEDEFLDALRPEERAARYEFGAVAADAPQTIVAEEDGELWGFATAGPSRDADTAGLGELYALYVDPPRWGTGTGRLLLAEARRRLGDAGYTGAILWVLRGNEQAARIYLADGWRRDGGERVEQPYGVVSTVVRFRRALTDTASAL
jgi:GNAT superfamily N-acetyltransferase